MVDPDEGWYNAVLSKSPEAYNEAEVRSFEDKMNGTASLVAYFTSHTRNHRAGIKYGQSPDHTIDLHICQARRCLSYSGREFPCRCVSCWHGSLVFTYNQTTARVRVYFKRWQLRASELANKRAEAKISAPLVYNRAHGIDHLTL